MNYNKNVGDVFSDFQSYVNDKLEKSRENGFQNGIAEVNALYSWLISCGRFSDLKEAVNDNSYCNMLLKNFAMTKRYGNSMFDVSCADIAMMDDDSLYTYRDVIADKLRKYIADSGYTKASFVKKNNISLEFLNNVLSGNSETKEIFDKSLKEVLSAMKISFKDLMLSGGGL